MSFRHLFKKVKLKYYFSGSAPSLHFRIKINDGAPFLKWNKKLFISRQIIYDNKVYQKHYRKFPKRVIDKQKWQRFVVLKNKRKNGTLRLGKNNYKNFNRNKKKFNT